jgi:hypothetical protein
MVPFSSIKAFVYHRRVRYHPHGDVAICKTCRVDTWMLHRTEPRVPLHPGRVVHETLCLIHEGDDIFQRTLGRQVDIILTCPFRNPDRPHERVVEIGNIRLELGSIRPVPIFL